MTHAELLMEKCYIEQEIARKQAEELRKQNATLNPDAVEITEAPATLQKEEKQEACSEGVEVAVVTFHRHAKAYIYSNGVVEFWGKSGGLGCTELSAKDVYQNTKHILNFYNYSEYVTNGITARVQLKLMELGL